MISTLLTLLCLPLFRALRGLAEMGLDPCYRPGDCTSTYAHLALADHALAAVPFLIVLQWPAAYLLRPQRRLIALLPAAGLLVMVAAVMTIDPGT